MTSAQVNSEAPSSFTAELSSQKKRRMEDKVEDDLFLTPTEVSPVQWGLAVKTVLLELKRDQRFRDTSGFTNAWIVGKNF